MFFPGKGNLDITKYESVKKYIEPNNSFRHCRGLTMLKTNSRDRRRPKIIFLKILHLRLPQTSCFNSTPKMAFFKERLRLNTILGSLEKLRLRPGGNSSEQVN